MLNEDAAAKELRLSQHFFMEAGSEPKSENEVVVDMMEHHREVIATHPFYKQLVADSRFRAVAPNKGKQPHGLCGKTLYGEKRIYQAYSFSLQEGRENSQEADYNEYVTFYHLGAELCGHQGLIHGGLIATLLDESLTRTAFPLFEKKTGVTGYLNINYRSPSYADNYFVIIGKVVERHERKIKVSGYIKNLTWDKSIDEEILLVEAECLAVQPRYADHLNKMIE